MAGFIGPEVFRTAGQLQRTCLEDIVMAKLHGLTMGLDVCATFHMGIAPDASADATRRIVELAAPAYLMAVAGNADPMLGYLTTSFREHPQLRRLVGRHITTAMSRRLAALGAESTPMARYAAFMTEGGVRSSEGDGCPLPGGREEDANGLRSRGYDLGYGHEADYSAPPQVRSRMEAIYAHARHALYAVSGRRVSWKRCPSIMFASGRVARSRRLPGASADPANSLATRTRGASSRSSRPERPAVRRSRS